MIKDYHFGSIVIEGKTYKRDVQIFPSGELKAWQRKVSHEVAIEDVKEVLEQKPEIIVFGTGSPGMLRVFDDIREEIKSQGIELIIEPTKKAIEKFNELKNEGRKTAGFFHLTC
ncbi:MAG: hypothetical protein COV69_00175 [Parcubacteria group bacterium CG11_big_fil_rev_8_21_14_0_20_39_14]|nr:MAG: hypothetical protein COV69_00175 [Parcubacteria group bacterium CG11_big_fil_rev_8_21_14_0_20_39_14]PIS35329.1 MAG: hypothetical protein COT36_03005 [Parcubacteria group bacterium CG08_land_8_20_14_0_20_38_56]